MITQDQEEDICGVDLSKGLSTAPEVGRGGNGDKGLPCSNEFNDSILQASSKGLPKTPDFMQDCIQIEAESINGGSTTDYEDANSRPHSVFKDDHQENEENAPADADLR